MFQEDKNCFNCNNICGVKSYAYKSENGLTEQIISNISEQKQEPSWMLQYRLKAFEFFKSKDMQKWGPDLKDLNVDDLCFYLKPIDDQKKSWNEVPEDIRESFEREGVSGNTDDSLGGLGAQYESEVVFHNLKEEWEKQGVIFLDTDTALKKYPEIFKEYFGTVVPFSDNKFSALNSAVWSGGSFIYVPKGVHVDVPLQAYYRMQSQSLGQFERTLIIADENSSISYIEGCTAPLYSKSSLHSAVVEIVAKKGAKVKYYTIQNWSKDVYNLVTKRAVAYSDAIVEWIDCNIGSGVTMKYPAVILKEKGAKMQVLSLSMAGIDGQIQDSGAKAIHLASDTSSKIIAKSISSNGGQSSFRGVIKVLKGAEGSKSFVQCDGLLMDDQSRSDAYPYIDVSEKNADVGHEARVSRIADEQIFYLMSRGIDLYDAQALIVNGFVETFVKELPVEYAIEIGRFIELGIKNKRGNNEK